METNDKQVHHPEEITASSSRELVRTSDSKQGCKTLRVHMISLWCRYWGFLGRTNQNLRDIVSNLHAKKATYAMQMQCPSTSRIPRSQTAMIVLSFILSSGSSRAAFIDLNARPYICANSCVSRGAWERLLIYAITTTLIAKLKQDSSLLSRHKSGRKSKWPKNRLPSAGAENWWSKMGMQYVFQSSTTCEGSVGEIARATGN